MISQVTVTLDTETEYQTIEGFGAFGPMNVWWSGGPFYSSTWLDLYIDDLGVTIHRDEYYPDGGGRYPSNSDDQDSDWDEQIPSLQAINNKAIASGEPMKFIVTFWTVPRQWKTNNSHKDGGYLKEANYNDFAGYCVDVVRDYNDIGIDLYALSIQNELRFAQYYNSGEYEPEEYAKVVKLVGKGFDDAGFDTKTFGCEDMGSYSVNVPWIQAILEDDLESRKYMDIWAVHSYLDGVAADYGSASGWTGMFNKVDSYNKPLWMTETSGYDNSWPGGAFDLAKSMYLALEYGNISAWVYWYITDFLDGTTRTKKYYSAKQYYRYIRPGAKHIKSTSTDADILVTSYKHPEDGRLTVVIINNSSSSETINLYMGSYNIPGSFRVYRTTSSLNCSDEGTVSNNTFSLPGQSISTLVYESSDNGPSIEQTEDIILLNSAGQQSISLSGITDGGDGGQTITVSAISSDPSVIPNPTITYTSPNSTGTLNFTPQAGNGGNVVITVLVSDNGDDSGDLNVKRMHFNVKVLPFINAAPTIDTVVDFKVGTNEAMSTKILTGISDGNDGSQNLTVKATSAVPQALEVAAIYAPGSDEITLYYNTTNVVYTIPVTLTITDDGGIDLGGVDTKTITFNVTIEAGYVENPLGFNSTNSEIIIFPNPAQNFLNIISFSNVFDQIRICDNLGRIMHLEDCDSQINTNQINIQNFEKGMYVIQLFKDDQKVFTRQFIKN